MPFCNSTCYGAWQKGRSFDQQEKPKRPAKFCKIDGCSNEHFGKGYCRSHYVKLAYTPPKVPTDKTTSTPHYCLNCGAVFIAHHKNPKYCSRKCSSDHRKKPFIIKKGYKKILSPLHNRADGKGYVFEHILVAEKSIGRSLIGSEEVHHKDFDKQNNSPDNLLVCKDHAEHMKHHQRPSHSNE